MKVVLPDSSELELPDGATGRDAAAAIGPRLAEQAVLVRTNGHVQDLRLPLRDGDRAADRERLLLRLRVPGADLGVRTRADRARNPARDRRGPGMVARGNL